MSYRLGVLMDPIHGITVAKDSTLAMLLEAQRRGWEVRYLELGDLYQRDGHVGAYTRGLTVRDDPTDWFTLSDGQDQPLTDLDVLLMRKDPPVDLDYLYATHLLEQAERAGLRVVNRPQALRDFNEKLAINRFAACCAETLVASRADRIRAFVEALGSAVVKPLDAMGGSSIFRLTPDDPNLSVILETMTDRGRRAVMVQRYLPAIEHGDKRILLVAGQPIPYALARVPAAGEWRGNLAAGARGEARPLTERDRWIAEQVGPVVAACGLDFVGLDVIGDFLTEVNVTSPTCIRELDAQCGLNIAGQLLDAVSP